jgi:hypothetical protein
MRILLSLAIITLIQFNLYSTSDTSKVAITVTKFGDYLISNHASVHGNIISVKHSGSSSETDSLITILNSKGKVLFKERVTNDESSDLSISVDTLIFCGVGTLLAYNKDDNASYGNCTNSIQLWGYNKTGEFVPFTGFIPVCAGAKPIIRWAKSKVKLNSEGNEFDCPSVKDTLFPYVVVQHETGFCEVTVSDYYKIDFNGLKNTKGYAAEKIEKQQILAYNDQIYAPEFEKATLSTIRLGLYSKPILSSPKKTVSFKTSNIVKFQYCTQTKTQFWICVKINDTEGFMLLKDLEKLGFEKCE